MATCAMASIHSLGVSPRLMPRSNRSTSAGISPNSGSIGLVQELQPGDLRIMQIDHDAGALGRFDARLAQGVLEALRPRFLRLGLFGGLAFTSPHAGRLASAAARANGGPSGRRSGGPRAFNDSTATPRTAAPRRARPRFSPGDCIRSRSSPHNRAGRARRNGRIAHLAFVGLVARRHRGDLDVTDHRQVFLEPADEIAAHDLGVIEIELDAHIGPLRPWR